MKRLLFLAPVAAFAGLVAVFGIGLTKDPSQIPSQLIDRPLPGFQLVNLVAPAPPLASAKLRGEPLLLNIFASWCAACPQEHPVLTDIAKGGTPVYAIAWKDKPEESRAWLAKYGNPYRIIGADPSGRTGIDLGVTGVPETFVVDGRGQVRYKHVGPISPEDWRDTLQPMLARLRTQA